MAIPDIDWHIWIGREADEVLKSHSEVEVILKELQNDLGESVPEDFLSTAQPREPEDYILIRSESERIECRSWKEELEVTDAGLHEEEFQEIPKGEITTAELKDIIGEQHRSIISHEFDTCTECEGHAEFVCTVCEGEATFTCPKCEGQESIKCSDCGGKGNVECQDCDGDGENACGCCDGGGEEMCPQCDGDGQYVITESCVNCSGGTITTKETCTHCQGSGCDKCRGGFLSASGSVKVQKACDVCGGNGETRRRKTCSECQGNCWIDCQDCAARGSQPCTGCGANGMVRCDRCNETGKNECNECAGEGTKKCAECEMGTIICGTCEGDCETHQLVVRITKLARENVTRESGKLPYGLDDPAWIDVDPYILEIKRRTEDGSNYVQKVSRVDLSKLDNIDNYMIIDSKYASAREVIYDYGKQNFTVREMGGEIYYTRYPERKEESFFNRIFSMI